MAAYGHDRGPLEFAWLRNLGHREESRRQFHRPHRIVESPGWPAMELIWTLDRPFWGNGYATEAAQAAMDYAFDALEIELLTSHIDSKNKRSRQVAKRLGQSPAGETEIKFRGRSLRVEIWEITREHWSQNSHKARPQL